VRLDALPALVRAIMPAVDTSSVDWKTVHPRAFRRAVRPALVVAAVGSLVFVALLGWWTLAAFALLAAWTIVATKRHVASLRWAITDNAVAFRSGWMWRFATVAPLAKVQAVSMHESPFDRRYGMASVLVDTAGGHDAPHRVRIPYLPREIARSLCDRLVASTASTAFRW
jgi:putative membrane protein